MTVGIPTVVATMRLPVLVNVSRQNNAGVVAYRADIEAK